MSDTIQAAIIGSSVLASLVAALFSILSYGRSKRIDFAYDYRKNIVEKRKLAYNMVEEIMVANSVQLADAYERLFWLATPKPGNEKHISKERQKIIDAIHKGFWLSEDLRQKLMEIDFFLQGAIALANRRETVEYELQIMDLRLDEHDIRGGISRIGEYARLNNELIDIFFKDVMTLDNFHAFRKAKTRLNKERTQSIIKEFKNSLEAFEQASDEHHSRLNNRS